MLTQRYVLGLEYDGSQFHGWQSQTSGRGVQDAVEAALAAIAGDPVRVHCSGRTDTGVHALQQIVHFDTTVARPDSAWVRGVNAHLPAGIAVRWARPIGVDFHARFSARSRSYRYVLLNRTSRPGLQAHRVGWYHRPLVVADMVAATKLLLGTHDFSAFRSSQCQAKSPVKTLVRFDLTSTADLLVFDLEANGFLHHMVRNLIGTLVQIGNGSRPRQWIGELLATRDRRLAAPTFSAAGLYFLGPRYDPAFGLPTVDAGGTAFF
jgi:tRNA pseudouridine38-40 synthase